MKRLLPAFFLCLLTYIAAFGQAPKISYTYQQTYTTGTAVPVLTPANTGGAVPNNAYGQVTTLAGKAGITGSANGTGAAASFYFPVAITSDPAGNLYVADGFDYLVRKVTPAGVVTTFAGTGSYGSVDGPAASATFNTLSGITIDTTGNLYVTDQQNETVRKITRSGIVSTIAGMTKMTGAINGQGTNASFYAPLQLAADKSGNLYVPDYFNSLIRKVTPAGLVSTYAGIAGSAGSANGPALSATFKPVGCAVDAQGDVYVADGPNNLIRKISPAGTVTTFAGSGLAGSADGTGAAASFSYPESIYIDAIGNLFVADEANCTIRKITPGGMVTTVAGKAGTYGSADGIGQAARFNGPYSVTGDSAGNIFLVDYGNSTIRKVDATGYSIDKPLPNGMSFDLLTGNISGTPTTITPSATYTISAYNIYGSSTTSITIGITGTVDFAPISPKIYGTADFTPAISTNEVLNYTSSNQSVATVVAGKIHIVSVGKSVITASNGNSAISQPLTVTPAPLTVIADNKSKAYQAADPVLTLTYRGFAAGDTIAKLTAIPVINTTATTSSLPGNYPITITGAEDSNYSIRYVPGFLTVLGGKTKVTAPEIKYTNKVSYAIGEAITPLKPTNTGGTVPLTAYAKVTTLAGNSGAPGFSNGTGTAASFNQPYGIAVDQSGNVFVSDRYNYLIRKITPAGVVSTFAGSQGKGGNTNGLGTSASFNYPGGIAIDSSGVIYVADQANNLIRKITPTGLVSTFAGTETAGSTDGPGTQASFYEPYGVALDKAGNLYVADTYNSLIRKITPSGSVSTFSGQKDVQVSTDGQGTLATFSMPDAISTDITGNIYVVDGHEVRKITPSGLVSTLVKSSNTTELDTAALGLPQGITTDAVGNVYIPDNIHEVIKKVSPAGVVTLIAGMTNASGLIDGIGTSVKFLGPTGLAADTSGNLYLTDFTAIRKISIVGYAIDKTLPPGLIFDPTTGIISGTPTAASPATNYTITGNNVGGASTSVINIKVPAITSLAKLAVSSGTLSPAFAATLTNYTLPVAANLTSVTVTPTVSDTSSRIMVNGLAVTSGTPSAGISLSSGLNSINVVVTGTDSTSTNYIIDVTRLAASNNANLAGLIISNGALTPAFSPATTSYTASVTNAVSSIIITPSASDTSAVLKINGVLVKSGSKSVAIPLTVGDNPIKVAVTAQDGTTINTYTIDVTRAPGNNDFLSTLAISSGTLSPAFLTTTTKYSVQVANTVSSISVTPTLSDGTAKLKVNGVVVSSGTSSAPVLLSVGLNTIAVAVTAQDSISEQTYTISVTRVPSSNAALSSLSISNETLTPAFAPATLSYTVNLPTADSTLTIKPIAGDTTAKVSVNGIAVVMGISSSAITLNPGSNTITVTVLAQDGSTSNTYVITANRALPEIYTLPAGNFKLTVTSATCKGSDNGFIQIAAVQHLSYTASITGNGLNKSYPFTDSLTMSGLAAGTYGVCISVAGQDSYQQCYDLVITEPKDLSVYATVDNASNTATLVLSGGDRYNISLNGTVYTTADSSITLQLNEGDNDISVTTDRLCQGTIRRSINISSKIIPYPVPFQNTLNLNIGSKTINNVLVEIHSVADGKMVYSKQFENIAGLLQLDVSGLKDGIYALNLSMDNTEKIFKIIKK